MKNIKQLLGILLVAMTVMSARADFRIYGTWQMTNNPAASNTMTINTNVLTWLPGITNTAQWVLITNTVGGNATNLFQQLGSFGISNVTVVSITNNTYVTVVGQINSNLTITAVGNYGFVRYQTSSIPAAQGVSFPLTREPPLVRTNFADSVVTSVWAYATQKFPWGTPALSYYLDDRTSQSSTNKKFWNFFGATGTVGKVVITNLYLPSTNLTGGDAGTIWFSTADASYEGTRQFGIRPMSYDTPAPALVDGTGQPIDIVDFLGGPASGIETNNIFLTIGSWWSWSPHLGSTNDVANFGGRLTNDWYGVNYFHDDGNNNYTRFDHLVDFHGPISMTGGGNISLGAGSINASNGTFSGKVSTTNFQGSLAGATNLGNIKGGTYTEVSSLQGSNINVRGGSFSNVVVDGSVASNLTTAARFDLGGDFASKRYDFTSLANSNNPSVSFGSNHVIRLAGTLTSDANICGVSGGRDGLEYWLFNDTGFNVTLSVDTVDPTPANRFTSRSGGGLTMPNKTWAFTFYDTSRSRWWMFSLDAVVATATNALPFVNAAATNLTVWALATNVVPLIVYSYTNSSTNTLEWQNSTGKVMSAIGPSGGLHIGGGSLVGASNAVVEGGVSVGSLTNQGLTASRLMASDAGKGEASVSLADGQIPIGNGGGYTAATITPGYAMGVTNRGGGIDLAVLPDFFFDDPFKFRSVVWQWSQAALVNIGGASPIAVLTPMPSPPDSTTGMGGMATNDAVAFSVSSLIDGTSASWGWGHRIVIRIKLTQYNTNQNEIVNFGFCDQSSASTMGTNTPSAVFIMCRASSSAPDVNYKLVSSGNGSTFATGDSGVAIDNTPLRDLAVEWNPAISNAVLYVNGIAKITNSANLPPTNQNLRAFFITKTLDAFAKSNKVEAIVMKQPR